jgi:hypothetical protein
MMSRKEINYGAENKLEIFIGAKIDASVVRLPQSEISHHTIRWVLIACHSQRGVDDYGEVEWKVKWLAILGFLIVLERFIHETIVVRFGRRLLECDEESEEVSWFLGFLKLTKHILIRVEFS